MFRFKIIKLVKKYLPSNPLSLRERVRVRGI
jgi:hypothetical protein